MKQQEIERDYWVEVGDYTVGADLYAQGTWEIDPEGFLVADEDPVFYKYAWFYKGEPCEVIPSDPDESSFVPLILNNIYWNEVNK
jgi:hypothetical protein